ncbi:hypothetical protein D3C87_534190 [compost metagenome]
MPRNNQNNQGSMGGQGKSLTPNEKYNAEFAVEMGSQNTVAQKARASHAEGQTHTNFQTPDEKFNAEFAEENNSSNKLGSLQNNSVSNKRQSRSRNNS